VQVKGAKEMKTLTIQPDVMSEIMASIPDEEREIDNLLNNASMQATNGAAYDQHNVYNRAIAQEFNH
jgi:hypothetical protein